MTTPNATQTKQDHRLVADRYRRVSALAEHIATNPGRTRAELARLFHFSERQVQADLNLIKREMGLPLVRRQGYRFIDEGGETGGFTAHEAQALALLLVRSLKTHGVPAAIMRGLVNKLPLVCPPHLARLVQQTVDAACGSPGAGGQVFVALSDAILRDASVRIHYYGGQHAPHGRTEPLVRPERLVAVNERWYLLADHDDGQTRMVALDALAAVTAAEIEPADQQRHVGRAS